MASQTDIMNLMQYWRSVDAILVGEIACRDTDGDVISSC